MTLVGEREAPLFVDADVAGARHFVSGNRPALALRLTDAAATRVAARTQAAAGREVIVEWEGRVVARLRVGAPLARDLVLSAASDAEARLMSAVLRGGRWPEGVTIAVAP